MIQQYQIPTKMENLYKIKFNTLEKLALASKNKKFTDLDLVLVDLNGNQKELSVHKVILYVCCPYFQTFFDSDFSDKDKKQLVIKDIPDVYVAYDLIQNFYNVNTKSHDYPDWQFQIQYIKCIKFFMFDVDQKLLPVLKIPMDGFDNLVDLIDSYFGYNQHTIKCLVENLPDNYDLNKFPKELVKQMYDMCNNKIFTIIDRKNDIQIQDLDGSDIQIDRNPNLTVMDVCFAYSRKYMAIFYYNQMTEKSFILVWNFKYGYSTRKTDFQLKVTSPVKIFFIYGKDMILIVMDGTFYLVDLYCTFNPCKKLLDCRNNEFQKDCVQGYAFSAVKKYLATVHDHGTCLKIVVHMVKKNDVKYLGNIILDHAETKICFSPCSDILLSCTASEIILWNTSNFQEIKKISMNNTNGLTVRFVKFLSTYQILVIFSDGGAQFYGQYDLAADSGLDADDFDWSVHDPLRYWQNYDPNKNSFNIPNFHPNIKGICDGDNLVTYDNFTVKFWNENLLEDGYEPVSISHKDEIHRVACQTQCYSNTFKKLGKFLFHTKIATYNPIDCNC